MAKPAPVSVVPMPYNGPMVASLLRGMSAARLATVSPKDFQRWPAVHILDGTALREMIASERASRR